MTENRSASSLVLTNSDLLHCIFVFNTEPRLPLKFWRRRRDCPLVRWARVCRAFHEPAIRILWSKLDSFLPLWHLLAPRNATFPSHTVFGGDRYRQELSSYLDKVISAQLYRDSVTWDRFLWHATHVRHIAHSTSTFSDPACKSQEINNAQRFLIQAVLTQNGGNSIFPLLHSIRWENRAPNDDSLIPFFTSTLSSIALGYSASETNALEARALRLLLRKLRESSPWLEKIGIYASIPPPIDMSFVRELLLFDQLRDIQVRPLPQPATVLDLVSKPNLVSFGISNIFGPWSSAASSPSLVHDLRDFSVSGTASGLTGLFNLVRFQALESVYIHIVLDDDPPPQDNGRVLIDDVLRAFHDAVAFHGSFRSFSLRVGREGMETASIGLRDLVRSILPLREIRSFQFKTRFKYKMRVEGVDIEALAGAWPNLEHLILDGLDVLSTDTLHSVHTHCHALEKLVVGRIRCPAVGVHPIPPPICRPSPHPLRRFRAGDNRVGMFGYGTATSSNEAAEAVARYLLELFPGVDAERSNRMVDLSATSTSACQKLRFLLRAVDN